MIYFKFINSNKQKYEVWDYILYKFIAVFIPQANPDFYDKYHEVSFWYIEFDDIKNYANREIGLDANGKIIVKGPYKENFGFWTDEDLILEDYEKFDIEIISVDEFEKLWEQI